MYRRIRDLREDRDLRQQDVADSLGLWLNTYRNYENGNRKVPLNIAILLANFYGVSLDYLAGRSNK